MDVSSPAAKRTPIFCEVCCDICGYPRTGLVRGSLCPECGGTPPVMIEPAIDGALMARDRSVQAWLMSVGAGLVLLFISSIWALRVVLIMPMGGLVLTALNAPGPKLFASALLMRSIGDPGEWGIFGTIAVLANLVAIWLITEPRSILGSEETGLPIRNLARWVSILAGGAMFGVLVGGFEVNRWNGWTGLGALCGTVGLVELPANTLLYLYLRDISQKLDDPGRGHMRELPLLRAAAWMLPAVCAIGACMSLVRGQMQDQPIVAWRIAQSVYGALSIATGTLMTIGVLRLIVKVAAATTDRSVRSLTGRLARIPRWMVKSLAAIRSDPTRWAAVLGLAVCIWNIAPLDSMTAGIGHRMGFGGDLPAMNFVGPKVWAVPLLQTESAHYGYVQTDRGVIISTVLAIWLITTFRPGNTSRAWSAIVRWVPTILVGLTIGLGITIDRANPTISQSAWIAAIVTLVEAPCTLVFYLYLATIAGATAGRPLARDLRLTAVAATILILLPLGFFGLSRPLLLRRAGVLMLIADGTYGTIAIALSIFAFILLVRLTVSLARSPVTESDGAPTIAPHDPSLARANAV